MLLLPNLIIYLTAEVLAARLKKEHLVSHNYIADFPEKHRLW